MRLRGRSVALLLASALPLLADDTNYVDAVDSKKDESQRVGGADALAVDEDENDYVPLTAAEAIHSDGFKLPSLQPSDTPNYKSSSEEEAERDAATEQHGAITEDPATVENGDEEIIDASIPIGKTETESHDRESKREEDEVDEVVSQKTGVTETPSKDAEEVELSLEEDNSTSDDGIGSKDDNMIPNSDSASDSGEIEETVDAAQGSVSNDDSTVEVEAEAEREDGKSKEEFSTEIIDEEDENITNRVSVDYASKSAGALIIEKSSSFKGTSNLLNGDKDKYAIAPCEDKKFVVVSLSEDILVKEIKLANFERFSSSVKEFQVLGSQTLGKWFDLGNYTAKSGNGEQVFELMEPAWARYLKFKLVSHHGVEYYCTVSQIKVHGSTMVQGFHEQWEESEQQEEMLSEAEAESVEAKHEENSDESLGTKERIISIGDKKQAEATKGNPVKKEDGGSDEHLRVEETNDDNVDRGDPGADATQDDNLEGVCTQVYESSIPSSSFGKFSTSTALDAMLQGVVHDESLPNELYEIIPTTLSSLPPTSRESRERHNVDSDLRTLHQLGTLAMQSIYSSSRMAADAAKAIIAETSGTIVSPKMTDRVGGEVSQYIDSDLGETVRIPSRRDTLGSEKSKEAPDANISPESDEKSSQAEEAKGEKTAEKAEPTVVEKAKKDEEVIPTKEKNSIGTEATASEEKKDHGDEQTPLESAHALDPALARMLENVPSAGCLSKLDFGEFKAKMLASKKAAGGHGPSHAGSSQEPIFKKLTDEIKALQTNLSIQDQFTKTSVACYQRLLLDLVIEMETMKTDQGDRLLRLEDEFRKSQSSLLVELSSVLLQGLSQGWSFAYSASFFAHTWTSVWAVTLLRFCSRLPSVTIRYIFQYWPGAKETLLSKTGTDFAETLSPFIVQMDNVADRLSDDPMKLFSETQADGDEALWAFPIVPTILLIFFGRLVMCFAGSGRKHTDTKKQKKTWVVNKDIARKKNEDKVPELLEAETPAQKENKRPHDTNGKSLVTP